MASTSIVFSGDQVGLIIRGKKSHTHSPGVLEQHADCILSNGAPIGFFGKGNAGSSGGASSGIGGSSRWSAGSSNSSGVGMTGVVYDHSALSRARANYVDGHIARGTGTVSAVLLIQVSATEAAAFDKAWADMTADPGMFNIVGWNCATHASQAFRTAGILSAGIPGLDTPDNLYRQLCFEKVGKLSSLYGYAGFSAQGSGFMLTVEDA